MTDPAAASSTLPRPLLVALAVVALEALAFLAYGVAELFSYDSERPEVALTSAVFFLVYAAFLGFFAWRLSRVDSWARAPLVMAQLIQVPVAISFWGGEVWTNVAAGVLVASSLLVLGGIFHPRSIAVLEDEG